MVERPEARERYYVASVLTLALLGVYASQPATLDFGVYSSIGPVSSWSHRVSPLLAADISEVAVLLSLPQQCIVVGCGTSYSLTGPLVFSLRFSRNWFLESGDNKLLWIKTRINRFSYYFWLLIFFPNDIKRQEKSAQILAFFSCVKKVRGS
jgi:hypothetical protein